MKTNDSTNFLAQTNPATGNLIAIFRAPSTKPLSRIMRNAVSDRLRSARIDGDIVTVEYCERLLATG